MVTQFSLDLPKLNIIKLTNFVALNRQIPIIQYSIVKQSMRKIDDRACSNTSKSLNPDAFASDSGEPA